MRTKTRIDTDDWGEWIQFMQDHGFSLCPEQWVQIDRAIEQKQRPPILHLANPRGIFGPHHFCSRLVVDAKLHANEVIGVNIEKTAVKSPSSR